MAREKLIQILALELLYDQKRDFPKKGEVPRQMAKDVFKRGRPAYKSSRCAYCHDRPSLRHRSITITSGTGLERNVQQTTYDICESHLPALFAYATDRAIEIIRQGQYK